MKAANRDRPLLILARNAPQQLKMIRWDPASVGVGRSPLDSPERRPKHKPLAQTSDEANPSLIIRGVKLLSVSLSFP